MKTKFYWIALLACATQIAQTQAQAGGHHGGGGGGGHFAAPSFHSMPMRNFGGGRMIYSGQRFSPVGSSSAFRQHYINSNRGISIGARQFSRGNITRGDRLARFSNGGNHAIANRRVGQIRSRNGLPTNWRDHVVAQHAANWHRDWDRSRDHSWHGHHCRFLNGWWVIFDSGFYPWWQDWYPDDYYASDYYAGPYGYDPGYDQSGAYQGEEYYNQGGSADQSDDSPVAAAQELLARQGYYRGEIDGVFGLETRRAVTRYQSNHDLRATGNLNSDTIRAMGLQQVASN